MRKKAIDNYFGGESLKNIEKVTGLTRQHIYRLVKKCIKRDPSGNLWGYRGLIPYKRLEKIVYNRVKKVTRKRSDQKAGYSGALTQLFERYPDIQEDIESLFMKNASKVIVHESRIQLKTLHKKFLDACRAHGIKNEYPFIVDDLGRVALLNYLKKLLTSKYGKVRRARFGEIADRNARTGGPEEPLMPVEKPYVRVEFDGHKFDITFAITITLRGGATREVTVDRFWILLIRECFTGAILGYHLAFGREYNKYDVMTCIKKSIMPWQPRELTVPGLKYSEHGGMPSEVIEGLKWAIFEEMSYDGARANKAKECKRVLKETIGCSVNEGPSGSPEYRAMVETFFGLLEENGFHRLPSTLGSSPNDIRRNDPEGNAIRFNIRLEHLEDLVAVLISNFNGTPAKRLDHISPLEYLKMYASLEDTFIPTLEESKRRNLYMFDEKHVVTVRGNMKRGERPHINLMHAVYTSSILSDSNALIGKKLTIYINPLEPRTCLAFLPDGTGLGILTARGIWGSRPHTLELRREIVKAKRSQMIHYTENDDPIEVYCEYLTQEALKSKNGRKKLIKLAKAVEKVNNSITRLKTPSIDNNADLSGQDTTRKDSVKVTGNDTEVKPIIKKTYLL